MINHGKSRYITTYNLTINHGKSWYIMMYRDIYLDISTQWHTQDDWRHKTQDKRGYSTTIDPFNLVTIAIFTANNINLNKLLKRRSEQFPTQHRRPMKRVSTTVRTALLTLLLHLTKSLKQFSYFTTYDICIELKQLASALYSRRPYMRKI